MSKKRVIEGEVIAPGERPTFRLGGGRQQGKTNLMERAIADTLEKGITVNIGKTTIKLKGAAKVELSPEARKTMSRLMKQALAKAQMDIMADIAGRPRPRDITPKPVPKSRRLK